MGGWYGILSDILQGPHKSRENYLYLRGGYSWGGTKSFMEHLISNSTTIVQMTQLISTQLTCKAQGLRNIHDLPTLEGALRLNCEATRLLTLCLSHQASGRGQKSHMTPLRGTVFSHSFTVEREMNPKRQFNLSQVISVNLAESLPFYELQVPLRKEENLTVMKDRFPHPSTRDLFMKIGISSESGTITQ